MNLHQDLVKTSANYLEVKWTGGPGYFLAQGTWNGATATLQVSSNHGDWVAAGPNTTFTADGVGYFSWYQDGPVRVVISSAGASTNLKLTLVSEIQP